MKQPGDREIERDYDRGVETRRIVAFTAAKATFTFGGVTAPATNLVVSTVQSVRPLPNDSDACPGCGHARGQHDDIGCTAALCNCFKTKLFKTSV